MYEIFNFRRFLRLFVKHTTEHYRVYLMSISVLAGVLLLGGAFVFYLLPDPPDPTFQEAAFVFLLIIAGTIFTSTIFTDFGEKRKAIPALTLPATALEKFLVAWLYSFPIFLLVYIGVFYLALYGLSSGRHWEAGQRFYMLNLRHLGLSPVFPVYAFMQALVLYGAIFFKKLHFIKTGFAFFASLGTIILCNTLLLKIMTGLRVIKLAIPFGNLDFYVANRNYSILPVDPELTYVPVLMALSTLLIWIAAYFRLRETQV
jgi:hypothetical protein